MLTTQQVAERLGVEVVTVQRWLRRGELKGARIGGRTGWRIRQSELERFIRRREGTDE